MRPLRCAAAAALLGAAGCASMTLGTAPRPEASAPAGPCHLLLVWPDPPRGKAAPEPEAPESLARALASRGWRGCAPATWQIVRRPEDLLGLVAFWRPAGPVLFASLQASAHEEEDPAAKDAKKDAGGGKKTAAARPKRTVLEAKGRIRLQARLFETSPDPAPGSVRAAPASFVREALALLERQASGAQPPALKYWRGKGPVMEAAFAAAGRADWDEAARQWEEAARRDPGPQALHNLSVAHELRGDLEAALAWQERLIEAAGDGLGASIKLALYGQAGDPREREAALRGLLELRRPPAARLDHASPLAVLPLDNETPDFDADERVRAAVAQALAQAGYRPSDAGKVDAALKKEGVTMAGHLKALSWERIGRLVGAEFLVAGSIEEFRVLPAPQVRARLTLLHAPTGREVYRDTIEVRDADLRPAGADPVATLLGGVVRKLAGKGLAEESRLLARRWARPLPHRAKGTDKP